MEWLEASKYHFLGTSEQKTGAAWERRYNFTLNTGLYRSMVKVLQIQGNGMVEVLQIQGNGMVEVLLIQGNSVA